MPSLHSSDPSHQTGEPLTTHQQAQYTPTSTFTDTQHAEAQPSLLDKAKAYIPVLGSATEFDPVTEARMQQDDKLYQEIPEGDTGFEPESYHHESLLDKAKAYMPAMGAPGTTTAGIDVSSLPHTQSLCCRQHAHASFDPIGGVASSIRSLPATPAEPTPSMCVRLPS